MSAREPVPECLEFAGMLGHTWHVTVTAKGGGERTCYHCSTRKDALKYLRENSLPGMELPAVAAYRLDRRRGWVLVEKAVRP